MSKGSCFWESVKRAWFFKVVMAKKTSLKLENCRDHKIGENFSKRPKWGFTFLNTEISHSKLFCCSCCFGQITKIFNPFVFLSSIIEALLKTQTACKLEQSHRMDQIPVYYIRYLILDI